MGIRKLNTNTILFKAKLLFWQGKPRRAGELEIFYSCIIVRLGRCTRKSKPVQTDKFCIDIDQWKNSIKKYIRCDRQREESGLHSCSLVRLLFAQSYIEGTIQTTEMRFFFDDVEYAFFLPPIYLFLEARVKYTKVKEKKILPWKNCLVDCVCAQIRARAVCLSRVLKADLSQSAAK